MVTLNVSELDQADQFRELQSTLRERWKTIELFDNSDADILVIPSLSIDQRELQKIEGCEHYEERLLFSLMRLRNPRTRLIYVTSMPLHPSIIDYYLQLLPGIPFSTCSQSLAATFYLRFFSQISQPKDFRTSPFARSNSPSFKARKIIHDML
jgi:hypothetical protein